MRFLVDVWRWCLHLLGLSNEHDERQSRELAIAICDFACAVRELIAHQQQHLVTKQDLQAAKQDIIKALGERVDPVVIKQLGESLAAHVAPLKKAMEDAPKISG